MSTVVSAVPDCSTMILQATWRDFNTIRQIEGICFPRDSWPIWDIISVLTLPNVVRLKAVCNNQTVGFIASDVRPAEKLAWIATICVLPEFRRQGIGTALLHACERRITLPSMRLNVRASNTQAVQLYKNLGYSQIGVWPRYYQDREDALILEKRVS